MSSLHWHILGAGSIGCLWAYHLTQTGEDCTLIIKSEYIQNLKSKEENYCFEKNKHVEKFQPQYRSSQNLTGIIDLLLVTVKSYQTLEALQNIQNHIGENTTIILLQNGMGVLDELLFLFPKNLILLATTTQGAFRKTPFHIVHAGQGNTWIGVGQGECKRDLKNKIVTVWNHAGLPTEWEDSIQFRLWNKLAINCVINPLTAILNCLNGKLTTFSEGQSLIQKLCDELMLVWGALELPTNEQSFVEIVSNVCEGTKNNRSSMLQDISNGRKTEIQYITGFLLKKAKEFNLSLPNHEMLYQQICFQEKLRLNAPQ
ncbi:MAG: 2-dehydropantoate 2-reductase [bacterium]|jgi:2-dehydropantoate 2-reductase